MKYWIGLSMIVILTGVLFYDVELITQNVQSKSSVKAAISISGYPRIVDGDTLKFPNQRVRFEKIDTCELSQLATTQYGQIDCGTWATGELSTLVNGDEITCVGTKYDRFKRLIAECSTNKISDLGLVMLDRGYAFPYQENRLAKSVREIVKNARNERRGVWGFTTVEKPYEWRKQNR